MANRFEEKKKASRAAYHEAGHAVANILYGLPFQRISVEVLRKPGKVMENGREVDVVYEYIDGIVWPEERKDLVNGQLTAGILDMREALSSMAGPVAEKRFVGKLDDLALQGAQMDINPIVACCRAALSGSNEPDDWKDTGEMEKRMLDAISAGSERLVRAHWTAVKAIAEALLEKQGLDYEEVRRIAEKNGLSKV